MLYLLIPNSLQTRLQLAADFEALVVRDISARIGIDLATARANEQCPACRALNNITQRRVRRGVETRCGACGWNYTDLYRKVEA